jgi:hypothetical protein
MAATIVLAVVAAMIHDIRWILIFAWPFASFAGWEFARTCSINKALVLTVTIAATIFSAMLLGWLYVTLDPTKISVVQPPPIADHVRSDDGLQDHDKVRRSEVLAKLRNKYTNRIIVDATPNYLMDLYNDKMPIDGDRLIAPFIGNWLLLSGLIWSVSKINTNIIHIVLEPQGIRLTYMLFDGQIYRLSVLRRNQIIWAFCQFKEATELNIHFEHCEVIDLD